ncbi:hypothetical protein F4604DRAFT_1673840 [Suillus subluteus]|nr:hypothetical protein F4604DRAFT_1673840 [Suillus subluteus]
MCKVRPPGNTLLYLVGDMLISPNLVDDTLRSLRVWTIYSSREGNFQCVVQSLAPKGVQGVEGATDNCLGPGTCGEGSDVLEDASWGDKLQGEKLGETSITPGSGKWDTDNPTTSFSSFTRFAVIDVEARFAKDDEG